MNDGVDGESLPGGEGLPGAEPSDAAPAGADPARAEAQPAAAPAPAPGAPAPWAAPAGMPLRPEADTPAPAPEPVAAAAYPSGYPQWASTPPPVAPPPSGAPWASRPDDPWAFTPPPPPPSYPGWTPAWPPGPAPAPRPGAPRRTAALAALLLFAAAAGASAGVVALTTHGTSTPTSTFTPSQPNNGDNGGGIFGNPGGGGSGPGSSTGNGGTPLDSAAIQAKLDPAIVDITVSLGGQGTAEGTGMVITSGGQILTNNHVIDGATSIKVQIAGTGPTYTASVVGYDVADDVALLQMQNPPSNLATVAIGDPNQLNVGDSVLALGNALGRGGAPKPAAGTVTALDQTITASDPSGQSETLSGLIETDANIQPGDSGGPLSNSSGQVIGMDTAASVAGGRFRFGGVAGQGYAIPISNAMTVVQQIRSGGGPNINTGQRALLGVEISDSSQGATVQGVTPGGPAEKAGIGAGDTITSVGGVQVTSASSLQAAIIKHKPGDRVSVTWLDANGGQHSATVTLTTGPPA